MRKKTYYPILFILIISTISVSVSLDQGIHSEGIGIVSVWQPVIVGIDFERDRFIYADELSIVVADLGFLKLKANAFFPYLTINLFGRELMVSWVFYYTPFVPDIISSILRKLIPMSSYAPVALTFVLITALYLISALKLASFLFSNVVEKKTAVIMFLFFLITSPSLYSLLYQFHHIQAGLFFNLLVIFLHQRRYFLSGIAGGLTLYSYAPSLSFVLGAYIANLLVTRNLKRITLAILISFLFILPYIAHIKIAENIDYKKIYGCHDCVFYNAYTELYKFFGSDMGILEFDKIGLKILADLITNTFSIVPSISEMVEKIHRAFSLSDIFFTYGFIYQKPRFHWVADLANSMIVAVILLLGALFLLRRFEFLIIPISVLIFISVGDVIPSVPKMVYILLPIFSVTFVEIVHKLSRNSRMYLFFAIAFLLVSSVRMLDLWGITQNYLPYFRPKETKEAVEFLYKSGLWKTDVYAFSMPVAFFLYSGGKINPPLVLPVYHPGTEEEKLRIVRFLIRKSRCVFADAMFEKLFERASREEDIEMKVVFRNRTYEIFIFDRRSSAQF